MTSPGPQTETPPHYLGSSLTACLGTDTVAGTGPADTGLGASAFVSEVGVEAGAAGAAAGMDCSGLRWLASWDLIFHSLHRRLPWQLPRRRYRHVYPSRSRMNNQKKLVPGLLEGRKVWTSLV